MSINFAPKTILGKWTVGLVAFFFLLLLLFQRLVAVGQRGGETYFSNLSLALPITLAGLCGIAAFFTGLVGILRQKERHAVVFVGTLLGLFVLWFVLGEFISPH